MTQFPWKLTVTESVVDLPMESVTVNRNAIFHRNVDDRIPVRYPLWRHTSNQLFFINPQWHRTHQFVHQELRIACGNHSFIYQDPACSNGWMTCE